MRRVKARSTASTAVQWRATSPLARRWTGVELLDEVLVRLLSKPRGGEVAGRAARAKSEQCGSAALVRSTMQRTSRYVTCVANQGTVSDKNLLLQLWCGRKSLVHQHRRPRGSSAIGVPWSISQMLGSVLLVTRLLGLHWCEKQYFYLAKDNSSFHFGPDSIPSAVKGSSYQNRRCKVLLYLTRPTITC